MVNLASTYVRLQIEKEKLFNDISEVLVVAMHWEEKAKNVLSREAEMSEFEDILRFCFIINCSIQLHYSFVLGNFNILT